MNVLMPIVLVSALSLGCNRDAPDTCQGPSVTITFNSDGVCSYNTSALTDCDYAEVVSLRDLGEDTCMNQGYECTVSGWVARPGSYYTEVDGSCKSE